MEWHLIILEDLKRLNDLAVLWINESYCLFSLIEVIVISQLRHPAGAGPA